MKRPNPSLSRFSMYVPAATTCGGDKMVVTRPCASVVARQEVVVERFGPKLVQRMKSAHPLLAPHASLFPELRLIEYDCGE